MNKNMENLYMNLKLQTEQIYELFENIYNIFNNKIKKLSLRYNPYKSIGYRRFSCKENDILLSKPIMAWHNFEKKISLNITYSFFL